MKRFIRLGVSLRTRLTLWYGALLALTLLAFSALLYVTLQQSLSRAAEERLTLRAEGLRRELSGNSGSFLQPEDVPPGKVEVPALDEFVAPGIYVQILNTRGAVVVAPPNLAGGELPVPEASLRAIAADQRTLVDVPVAAGDANVRVLTTPLHGSRGELVGAIQVGESLSPLESTMAAVARLLLGVGAAALLLAVVVGWLLTRRALSPVARITKTARHIAATGDYSQRLHVDPPAFGPGDELFFLAATFNDMIARLEHMLESQRRLLADTSHELRNPVTVIRGNLALLRREAVPEDTRREAVIEAEEEATRMGRLVGDLLLLARADAGEMPTFEMAPVDLAALAREVVDRARAGAASRRLDLTAPMPCLVLGDRDRLRQMIANLVENSVRYTPAGGDITVQVSGGGETPGRLQQAAGSARLQNAQAAMVTLTVSDTGIGIAAADLPHVFERFYRADKARSRAGGGSGLGLSIAEYIVRAHSGSIDVTSDGPNRGSTFHVRLPLLASGTTAQPEQQPRRPSRRTLPRPAAHPSLSGPAGH